MSDTKAKHPSLLSIEGDIQNASGNYIFKGPLDVGKRLVAKELIAHLVCEKQGKQGCSKCLYCKTAYTGAHPDVCIITLEEGVQNIHIQQIQKITKLLASKPQYLRQNVVVIEYADSMTTAAANALLKTLEEPQTKTLFILLDNGYSPLLPTIVSRCNEIVFTPERKDVLVKQLLNQGCSKKKAEEIYFYSKGLATLAINFFTNTKTLREEKTRLDTLIDVLLNSQNVNDSISITSNASWNEKQSISYQYLEDSIYIWHNILLYKCGLATYLDSYHNQKALEQFCAEHNAKEISQFIEKALLAKTALGKSIPGDIILETLNT